MLRSNCKVVRERIRAYILECAEGYELHTMEEVYNKFKVEKGYEIPRKGKFQACEDWLRGLGISVDYAYYDIAGVMAEWFNDTRENQLAMIDKNGDNKYWHLLAREITNA